ncbi:MAG TPA: hypothetical protein VN704_03870, partial [Verrucomicrobiae bacterium]|nr:hypothetical protein [Verrucomicrobiae bacterium]
LFNAIILLSSISIILIGIIGIDRSKVFYWMVSYGFCLVLFWPRLNKKQHKGILIVSGLILSAVMLYFLVLTFSRFDIQDTGGGGSMISYGGQAFINFSFFFDKVNYREFTLQRIFPLVYKLFVDNGIQNTGQLNEVIGLQTGKNLGVFSTFIGDIMVACGRLVAILYCIIFYFLSRWLLGKRIILNFYQLVFLFCLITVPMLGIFVDYYAGFEVTIPLICFLIYAWNLRFRHLKYITQKKLKLKNNEPPILD